MTLLVMMMIIVTTQMGRTHTGQKCLEKLIFVRIYVRCRDEEMLYVPHLYLIVKVEYSKIGLCEIERQFFRVFHAFPPPPP